MPDPRIRTKGRERALQFLFALDFTNYAWQDTAEDFWELNPTRPAAQQYAQQLVEAIEAKRDDLDREIASAVHNWTPERVGRIERAILRIALYEMRYADDVPVNVAINEAIELAKRFGADESPRFVNGVLDRLKMLSSGSGGRARKP